MNLVRQIKGSCPPMRHGQKRSGVCIREDNITERSMIKVRTVSNDGSGRGQIVFDNPNATNLVGEFWVRDVPVTIV